MIQQTSLFSYYVLLNNPLLLNNKQKSVYNTIKLLGKATDKDIARVLSWPINTITPRRGELVKLGLIEKKGTTLDTITNRPAYYWKCIN